jgi:hypothetical protein
MKNHIFRTILSISLLETAPYLKYRLWKENVDQSNKNPQHVWLHTILLILKICAHNYT